MPKKKSGQRKKDQETLGQRVARVRRERGYTQAELGERIGLRQSHLSDLETGRLQFSAEVIAKLAESLHTTADELLGLKPTRSAEPKTPRRLLRRIQQIADLPLSQQRALLKMVDAVIDRERLRKAQA